MKFLLKCFLHTIVLAGAQKYPVGCEFDMLENNGRCGRVFVTNRAGRSVKTLSGAEAPSLCRTVHPRPSGPLLHIIILLLARMANPFLRSPALCSLHTLGLSRLKLEERSLRAT